MIATLKNDESVRLVIVLVDQPVLVIDAPRPAAGEVEAKGLGFPPALARGLQVKIRLAGIDAPEMKTEAGKAAKIALVKMLPQDMTVEAAQDYYDKKPDCWDRYGRMVGWLWVNDRLINEEMVDTEHAQVRYLRESSRYWGRMQ